MKITSFGIKKLHGHFSLKVPIENNRLVLVGENGTGKSTFVSMLHFALAKQWHKFDPIQFEEITLGIDENTYSFSKEVISELVISRRKRARSYPIRVGVEIERAIAMSGVTFQRAINNIEIYEFVQSNSNVRIPFSTYNEVIKEMMTINKSSEKRFQQILNYEKFLDDNLDYSVIFLPTYRRIEKEIENILPNYDEDYRERFVNRPAPRRQSQNLELIEFGMVDITKLFSAKMEHLSNSFRNNLQKMTTEYLLDVLGTKYVEIDTKTIDFESLGQLESMLDRIGGEILPDVEKSRLKDKISKMKDKGSVEVEDKIILDFVLKIVDLQKVQEDIEKEVQQFVLVSNKYLVNKKIVFDNRNFEMKVINTITEDSIELSLLSSGEKQVVAIFSHLFLTASSKYLLIFDEPELSLSVPWQKSFLEDISNSVQCNGVIAVTHSPFIYDNSLVVYSRSINEFMVVE